MFSSSSMTPATYRAGVDAEVGLSDSFLPRLLLSLCQHPQDFLNANAQFDVGASGSKVLQNCLAYKLCYYRFGELRVRLTLNTAVRCLPCPRPSGRVTHPRNELRVGLEL